VPPLTQVTDDELSKLSIYDEIPPGRGGLNITVPLTSIVPSELHIT